jgi:CrcB protein
MPNILLVMLGGAAGAGLRYEVGRLSLRHFGFGFPWGTLIVNLAGGLLIGLLAGWLLAGSADQRPVWMLLAVGLLGGFTTFSAFSFDLFLMLERGQIVASIAYAAASVAGSVVLLCLGFWLARAAT